MVLHGDEWPRDLADRTVVWIRDSVGRTIGLNKTVSGPHSRFGQDSQRAAQWFWTRQSVGPIIGLDKTVGPEKVWTRVSGSHIKFG